MTSTITTMTTMTTTKGIAAAAAVTLLAGLGTAVGATSSQAQTNAHTPATASKAAGFEVTAKVSNAEPEQGDRIKSAARHRGRITAFALQLLTSRRTVMPCAT
jgi:hypothetical protein